MKYKAIIFDLFGTLVDNYSVQGYNRLLTDMASALRLPEEDFSKIWRDTTYERGTGIFKTTEESIRYVCNTLKVSVNDENIKKCVQIRRNNSVKALTPKNGAIEILQRLRGLGYKIGLITNCSAEVPLLWKNTDFFHLFDVTTFSASVGLKKPNPQIYTLTCDQLGVKLNECLFIGDGDGNELSGASQLGMDAVMIRDPSELDPYRLVEVDWDGPKIENFKGIMNLI
ncbi:MAG: HAD family hydrolase [Promethearchaeota archaeon]|jgi:putative hydrolase of the HAD superfamily